MKNKIYRIHNFRTILLQKEGADLGLVRKYFLLISSVKVEQLHKDMHRAVWSENNLKIFLV